MATSITFRKNGLYELLVAKAVEGVDGVKVVEIESSATAKDIRVLAPTALDDGICDETVENALEDYSSMSTLDGLITWAIHEEMRAASPRELCIDLFAKAKVRIGQPTRVVMISDRLTDHAQSVNVTWDRVEQFWTDAIVQAVSVQPIMMSHKKYTSSDIPSSDWVLVDRHVMTSDRLVCDKGVLFTIPVENLVEGLLKRGVQLPESWQEKAVENIRRHILRLVNRK